MAGRSWNDPKSARGRNAGSTPGGSDSGGAAGRGGSSPGGQPSGGSGGGRASWRDKGTPAVAQRGKERHWLVSRKENPNRLRYRVKLAFAALTLVILIGAFLVYTLWAPRNTPLLLVGILDYAAPLPPNAWTLEDFERFRTTLGEEGSGSAQNIRVYSGLGERQWKNEDDALVALEDVLQSNDMQPAGPDRNTVLIYLSGHGILDADGRPCLVLATDRGNTDLWQPQLSRLEDLPRLDLQKVLDTIEKSYADRSGTKKVVLLDCHRIHANPRLGILDNRFGEALKGLQFKDENLFLLSSADAGQWGWTLPDRGATAFGYYVCQGLAGSADETGNADGVVTLDELESYLRKQVSEQVQARYLVDQSPLLLSAKNSQDQAADTALAWANSETQFDPGDEISLPVEWSVLDDLWAQHEALKESNALSATDSTLRWRKQFNLDSVPAEFYRGDDLLSWEAFQQGLLRLEQLNDAGRYYTDEAQRLAGSLKLLAEKLRQNAEQSRLSSALALRQVDGLPALDAQVKRFIDGPVTEADQKEFAKLLAQRYELRAKGAWNRWVDWARSGLPAAAGDLGRTLNVLAASSDSSSNGEPCDPIEIRFLRLLDPNGHAPADLFGAESPALRSAILSRDLAEAAAWANDDVRVHYAIERLVARGDAARRRAEDQLFIRPAALEASGDPWRDAAADYAQALALAVELSEAIDARDQAWQELPYLAHWLVLRQETETDLSSISSQIARCQQLFAEVVALADAIDRLMAKCLATEPAADDETARRFAEELKVSQQELIAARTTVRDNLNNLLEYHRRAISEARLAAAPDVLNPREIHDLFSTPLLTGDDRRSLRETFLTSRRNVQTLRANRDEERARPSLPLTSHPLLSLFGGDTADLAADPDRLAGKLRAALHERFNAVASLSTARDANAMKRLDRMQLSKGEREARQFAALWTLLPDYGEPEKQLRDPVAAVAEFDRHHAVLWQASRALDDFWGSEGDPRKAWYFDALATAALEEARALGPGEGSEAYKSIDARLIERRQVARQWVDVAVPSVQLPPRGSNTGFVDARPAIQVAAKIPGGEAAVGAALAGKYANPVRYQSQDPWSDRLALALRAAAGGSEGLAPLEKPIERITLQLPDAVANGSTQTWNLNVFYRGHLYSKDFTGSPKEPGQLFELKREAPQVPRIIVYGEQRDRGAISLIFDCSGSMGETLPNRGTTLMEAAKDVLREIVSELADAESYRFSLWFYGHRFRFDTRTQKAVNIRDFYANQPNILNRIPREWGQPDTTFMSEDVSLEWPQVAARMPILTKNNAGEVVRLIDAAQPSGVTPLYYSLIRAIQEDKNLRPNVSPRRLIVLTDGENQIYAAEKRPQMRPQDVIEAFQEAGKGIELSMVAFGALARANAGEADLKGILNGVNQPDNYHRIRPDLGNLEEVVRQIIGLHRYEVAAVGQRQRDSLQEKVNREVILKDYAGRQQYAVRIVGSNESERLVLEGGEIINLYVTDSDSANPRLIHKRYSPEERKNTFASNASGANSGQKHYVGFQRTEREGAYTVFPISIQNADAAKFSPRPAEAWVEITPVGAGVPATTKPFVFYDLEFVVGRPVPVLECRALNWPAGANRARIKLFFKMQATNPTVRPFVRRVERDEPHPDLDIALPSGSKVQFAVSVQAAPEYKGARVTVTEYCASPADVHQAKVEIESPAPADIVRRQYFHSGDKHEVRHEFIYTGKVPEELMEYRVQITSRQALESNAATLHDVIEIPVN